MMGGSLAHEYMYLTPIGEDTLIVCDNGDYSSNRQVARFRKPDAPHRRAPAAREGQRRPAPKLSNRWRIIFKSNRPSTGKAVFLVATFVQDRRGD